MDFHRALMKIGKLDPNSPQSLGNLQITFGKHDKGLLHFYNQWEQFYFWNWKKIKWNWFNFTFFHLDIENDKMVPGYELEFFLLGFGFRFRWNRDWKKEETEATKTYKDFMKSYKVMLSWREKKTKEGINKEYQRLIKKLKEYRRENLKNIK